MCSGGASQAATEFHFSSGLVGASLGVVDVGAQGPGWGPYRLVEMLHAGRVARTYRALTEDQSLVSLKVLQPFANVSEQRAGLLREASIQACCQHPQIASVLSFGELEGQVYMARKYVLGLTLGELGRAAVRRGVRVPEPVVLAVGGALLQGLECVHGQRDEAGRLVGLIHRDVTPANVLIDLKGTVHLTDFGLAHAPALHGILGEDEILQGTRRYLPPEAARGDLPDARADLFQAALSLVEVLSGGPLRKRGTTCAELVQEDLQRVALELGPSGPVLAKALAPHPSERYASAAEMRARWSAAWGAPLPGAETVAEWLESALR